MVLVCSMRLVSLALCFITLECLSGRALECGEMLTDPGNACCSWRRWNPPPAHHWSCCLGLLLIILSVKRGDYSAYRIDGWDDVWEVMHDVWQSVSSTTTTQNLLINNSSQLQNAFSFYYSIFEQFYGEKESLYFNTITNMSPWKAAGQRTRVWDQTNHT